MSDRQITRAVWFRRIFAVLAAGETSGSVVNFLTRHDFAGWAMAFGAVLYTVSVAYQTAYIRQGRRARSDVLTYLSESNPPVRQTENPYRPDDGRGFRYFLTFSR